jgi:hypothetical protein
MQKPANEMSGAFSKEEVQMVKKLMKNCSTSLAIKEVQIKTISVLLEWLPSKTQTTNVDKDMGKKESSHTIDRK